jgi:hypothetical protein
MGVEYLDETHVEGIRGISGTCAPHMQVSYTQATYIAI